MHSDKSYISFIKLSKREPLKNSNRLPAKNDKTFYGNTIKVKRNLVASFAYAYYLYGCNLDVIKLTWIYYYMS